MSSFLPIKFQTFLRRLFAEGAFSQAFVPVLTESHAAGDMDKTRELIARAAGTLGVIVSVVTLLGVFRLRCCDGHVWLWLVPRLDEWRPICRKV